MGKSANLKGSKKPKWRKSPSLKKNRSTVKSRRSSFSEKKEKEKLER